MGHLVKEELEPILIIMKAVMMVLVAEAATTVAEAVPVAQVEP
jgi:hypothetical protein